VAKAKKAVREPYTATDIKLLKQHLKSRTPIAKISKQMKRSEGALRKKALVLGIRSGTQALKVLAGKARFEAAPAPRGSRISLFFSRPIPSLNVLAEREGGNEPY